MNRCSCCCEPTSHRRTFTALVGVQLVDLCTACYTSWLWQRFVMTLAELQAIYCHNSRP